MIITNTRQITRHSDDAQLDFGASALRRRNRGQNFGLVGFRVKDGSDRAENVVKGAFAVALSGQEVNSVRNRVETSVLAVFSSGARATSKSTTLTPRALRARSVEV